MNTMTDLSGTARSTMSTPRKPGLMQLAVLLAIGSLAALVAAVLGPSLPVMQAHFADVPNADVLVPLVMSAPSLSMALLAVVAGELADRWGRKPLLTVSAIGYAIFGTMPLYLDSLHQILASRFVLGAFEAALMTVSTALIADYYSGLQRDRYMTLQTAATSIAAVVMSLIGGMLASSGWRTPYTTFGVSLLLVPAILLLIWEPMTRATMSAAELETDGRLFRPGQLAWRCVLGLVAGLAFLVLGAHLGFLLESIGIESTQQVGLAYAITSLGMIIGTFLFGWAMAPRLSISATLGISGTLAGVSLAAMPFTHDFASMTTAGLAYGIAMGILFPTLVAWNMRELPVSKRGLGAGAFGSCLYLGMFLSPTVAIGLEKIFGGSRVAAVALEGHALLAIGLVAFLISFLRRR